MGRNYKLNYCFWLGVFIVVSGLAYGKSPVVRSALLPLPPLIFADSSGQASGLYPELLEAVAEQENWTIEWVPLTWPEAMSALINDSIDVLSFVIETPDRKNYLDYTTSAVFITWGAVFTSSQSDIVNILDMDQQRIGLVYKDQNAQNFKDLCKKFEISPKFEYFPTHKQMFQAIVNGKIQAAVAPQHMQNDAESLGLSKSAILFSPSKTKFAFRKGANANLRKTIDSYLTQWKANSNSVYYQSLTNWFGGNTQKQDTIPPWLLWVISISLGVTLGLILLNRWLNRTLIRKNLQLKEQEAYLRKLFNESVQIILILDQNGEIINSNHTAQNFFELSEADLENSLLTALPFFDREQLQELTNQITNINSAKELRREVVLHKDQQKIHFDISVRPIPQSHENDSANAFILEARNINPEKRTQQLLNQFRQIVANTQEIISIINSAGIVTFTSKAHEIIIGQARINESGSPLQLNDEEGNALEWGKLKQIIETQNYWEGKVQIFHPERGALFLRTTLAPIAGSELEDKGFFMIQRDITDDLRRQKEQQHSAKIESLGVLAGGIAHDFNNILSGIIGFASLAAESKPQPESVQDDLQEILKAGERAQNLVSQILTFSRKSKHQAKVVYVSELIEQHWTFIRASVSNSIEMKKEFAQPEQPIMIDETKFYQVITNLISNAAKAIEKSGVIHIKLRQGKNTQGEPIQILSVKDNGKGIPANIIQKIMDPYFTTRSGGQGTGLGLSVVDGIVREAKGQLDIDSTPGLGSTFTISFPVAAATDRGEKTTGGKSEQVTAHSTNAQKAETIASIVLVDDEKLLLNFLKRVLEKAGFQVFDFDNPQRALDFLEREHHRIDLLFTDLTMPEMTGADLVRALRKTNIIVPALLHTGHKDSLAPQDTQLFEKILEKPLKNDKIIEEISQQIPHHRPNTKTPEKL